MMILAIIASTMLGALVAALCLLLHLPLLTAAAAYFLASFSFVALVIRHWTTEDEHADDFADDYLEYELLALNESVRQDRRFHAGTPDAQEPLLFRRLKAQEERQDLKGRNPIFA